MGTDIHPILKKPSATVLYQPILLVSFPFTFLMFGLPIYSKGLGASALEIGGLYSIFTVVLLVLRPVVGWALDRFGRRPFFITALLGYSLSMLFFALASDLINLYVARLAQGIASSLMWVTVFTIVADLTDSDKRGQIMGRIRESDARGEMIGVLLGFMILNIFSADTGWKVAFFFYAALAFSSAFLAWKKVPETRPPGQVQTATSLEISPRLGKLMVAVFATGLGMALISPIYLIYLQDKFTTDISALAWAFFPAGILYMFLPSRLGKLSDRFGRAPLMAAGLCCASLLFILLPAMPNLAWLAVLYALTTVGWAMSDPAEAAMVADLTGNNVRGRGYGMYQFAANLGATVGPLLGGWLYDAVGKTIPFYINSAILLAAALWVILFLRGSTKNVGIY